MFRSNVPCLTEITFCYEFNFLKPATYFLTIYLQI